MVLDVKNTVHQKARLVADGLTLAKKIKQHIVTTL
jgi:hypothetical protein